MTRTDDPGSGLYTVSGTAGTTSTAVETNAHGAYRATFTEVLSDGGSRSGSGNAWAGFYALSQVGTRTASFVDRGTDAAGTFTVNETSRGGYTATTTGYEGVAITTVVEVGSTTDSATESLTGSAPFALTASGVDSSTATTVANGVTGLSNRTESGRDVYTLSETGTAAGGAFSQRVVGTDNYTGTDASNSAAQTDVGTTTGGGTWTRTSSGPGSTLASGSGTNAYVLSTTGNAIAGVFGESETGTDRYRLVQKFDDASNATSGQTPGNVTFHSHGLMFRDPPAEPGLKPRAVPRAMVDGDDPGMTPQQVQADKDAFVAARDEYTALSPTERGDYLMQQRRDKYALRYLDRTGKSGKPGEVSTFNALKYAGDKLGADDADLAILLMLQKHGKGAGDLLRKAEKMGIRIVVEGGWWRIGNHSKVDYDEENAGKRSIKLEKNMTVGEAADELYEVLKDNLSSGGKLEGFAKNFGLRGRHQGLLGKVDSQLDEELDELDQIWAAEVTFGGKATQQFVEEQVKQRVTGGALKAAAWLGVAAVGMRSANAGKQAIAKEQKLAAEAERLAEKARMEKQATEALQKEQAAAKRIQQEQEAAKKAGTKNNADLKNTKAVLSKGDAFEANVKNTFRKKIIRENEVLHDSRGNVVGEIDFETDEAIVEVGISLKGKTDQLHKLAEEAETRFKRLDVIYGPDTLPGTLEHLKESLAKK